MCGRFGLATPADMLRAMFAVEGALAWEPRHNVAPGQLILAVREAPGSQREGVLLRWGLVPSWAKGIDPGARMINARAETIAEKPAFRAAVRRRRCLVPADGFYEWARVGGRKQPYWIRLAGGGPFAMAGIWERWQAPDGGVLESCAVVTTEANELVARIHDRMPVILAPADYETWLGTGTDDAEMATALLVPYGADAMEAWPVSPRVNSPRNDGPELLDPLVAEDLPADSAAGDPPKGGQGELPF